MQAGLSTKNAPSIWVVAPHFLLGPLGLLIASVLTVVHAEAFLGYHLSGPVLAVVHLLMLGWITMIIFGALYQLIPVVMEVKLFSEPLAFVTLGLFVLGLLFLIPAFLGYTFTLTNGFLIGGSLVIAAVLLFVINIVKSALASEKKSISRLYIIASVSYLLLTVLYGLFILLNLKYNWLAVAHTDLLRTHAFIGLGGWFLMLIIGVAAKLIPMFLIVHKTREDWLKRGFYLINAGLLLVFTATFFPQAPEAIFGLSYLLVLAGMVLFLLFNRDLFNHRLRKKLDIGMDLTAAGLVLFLLSLMGFVLVYFGGDVFGLPAGRIEITAGMLLIYGFFTGLVLGQTYKTLPFIIWLFHYQKEVGKRKIPMPADLYSDTLGKVHKYTFLLSIAFFLTGLAASSKVLFFVGAVLMVITSAVYAFNVFRMIFHKKQ